MTSCVSNSPKSAQGTSGEFWKRRRRRKERVFNQGLCHSSSSSCNNSSSNSNSNDCHFILEEKEEEEDEKEEEEEEEDSQNNWRDGGRIVLCLRLEHQSIMSEHLGCLLPLSATNASMESTEEEGGSKQKTCFFL